MDSLSSSSCDLQILLFSVPMPFISFSCIILLVRASSAILNRSGKREHSCLTPEIRVFLIVVFCHYVSVFCTFPLSRWTSSFLFPGFFFFWVLFIKKDYWILSNAFFYISQDDHVAFVLYSINRVLYSINRILINWLINVDHIG